MAWTKFASRHFQSCDKNSIEYDHSDVAVPLHFLLLSFIAITHSFVSGAPTMGHASGFQTGEKERHTKHPHETSIGSNVLTAGTDEKSASALKVPRFDDSCTRTDCNHGAANQMRQTQVDIDTNDSWNMTSFPIEPKSLVRIRRGELPLVLSAPHGGGEKPHFVPDLTRSPRLADSHTIPLAQQLSDALKTHFGRAPFMVYNRLHRCKMDANRPVNEGTQGEAFGSLVYDAYHEALATCLQEARDYAVNGQPVLLLDIHGYTPPPAWNATSWQTSWVMIGHLVTYNELHEKDALEQEEWIRGPSSLGSLLEEQGLLAEPSSRQRAPSKARYFNGGYITETYQQDGVTQTIQLEFPRAMRNRLKITVPRVSAAVANLMSRWNMVLENFDCDATEDGAVAQSCFGA